MFSFSRYRMQFSPFRFKFRFYVDSQGMIYGKARTMIRLYGSDLVEEPSCMCYRSRTSLLSGCF